MKSPISALMMLLLLGSCAQDDKSLTTRTVSQETIKTHIYALAHDSLLGRETGTPQLKKAAHYLAKQFESYGVLPNPETGNYFQDVTLSQTAPPDHTSVSINGVELKELAVVSADFISTSEAVFVGYGMESDYQSIDVYGKIAVLIAGNEEAKDARSAYRIRDTKQALAQSKGAIAVIEVLNAPDQMWGFISESFNRTGIALQNSNTEETADFPYVWVLDKEAHMANTFKAGGFKSASLNMSASNNKAIVSHNIVGVVKGTDPVLKDEYIIYSAHYDHVGIGKPNKDGDSIYNGARDNAVGTTTVLSIAENIAKYPTKRSALFILFTGEEKGLLGSRYYVENPVLPLHQMVYCFNSDNGGYNDTSLATIVGLGRTTAEQHIVNATQTFGLKAIDDPAGEQGLFDRSDNVNFARKGIPAPTYSLGFNAFDAEITKYYHQPSDSAESLDYDYLLKFFQSYVYSGRLIANDPKTPTWTEGDKYEAAANELYGSN